MEKLNCFENWWYNKDKLWCMSSILTPDPSGRAGLCFVYQKPNMADTEFQEFLNCQNHDGSIFIKIMLCIFFSVNKMHQVYFQKVHLQKLSEKKKYQHTLCVKRKDRKRLCMHDIKKKCWSVDRGALTIPQGGTLYQARSDLLQTILAISQQFIHRLGNVFCHFINKQRWWSFSDYAGKNNMFPAPPLQYGIYQHLAHQELHAFYFYVYEKNLAGFVFHGRKKYMHASGIKSRDLYHIFDKLISNCSNRHR